MANLTDIETMGVRAKAAKRVLCVADTKTKNRALEFISDALICNIDRIVEENRKDIDTFLTSGGAQQMADRLKLDDSRIKAIANAVHDIVNLSDPIGKTLEGYTRPNGLKIDKVTVPLGVIGIIYESRPNVTVDAATLCIKSGNAVILRGGKEAINSNIVLCDVMRAALEKAGLPADCIQLVCDTTRDSATALMQLSALDVLIPRGGRGLIKSVVANSKVPVIETGSGNCHIYVDESANIDMAVQIVNNAKTQRVSVCNACESLLVNEKIADKFLPVMKATLDKSNVEVRGCEITQKILGKSVVPATDEDYATEFLDYIISVKVVKSIEEAVDHIMKYSTHHSECIVTENYKNAQYFTANIDSAAVYVNASTRFTDGGEFGFGAEIGISTQKLHARGPMGLSQMTSTKYIVKGDGQIR